MKLLREPMLHFIALGAVLMGIYAMAGDLFITGASRRIEINTGEIERLAGEWQRRWQRPPTEDDLRALVDDRVREEILYREALAVGLDVGDVIVRRRMVQKMEMLTQDLALLAGPTDVELRAFFDEHREDYALPPRVSFSHVYFNADRRGAAVEEDARRVLAEILAGSHTPQQIAGMGDRLMLERELALQEPLQVQGIFGTGFADALFELDTGWQGPITSGYGLHLVNVVQREPGRLLDYDEARDKLVMDFDRVRQERARQMLYDGLRGGYEIEIDEAALQRLATASRRPPSIQ